MGFEPSRFVHNFVVPQQLSLMNVQHREALHQEVRYRLVTRGHPRFIPGEDIIDLISF
jgi:hypothetical protein